MKALKVDRIFLIKRLIRQLRISLKADLCLSYLRLAQDASKGQEQNWIEENGDKYMNTRLLSDLILLLGSFIVLL